MILREIFHNPLEEEHHDDRHTQYRPCPVPARPPGAARAVNTLAIAARSHNPRDGQIIDDSPLAACVEPRDLLANREIRLPVHVRSSLTAAAESLVDVNMRAMSGPAFLDAAAAQDSRTRQNGGTGAVRGRARQDRTVNSMSAGRPASRCER